MEDQEKEMNQEDLYKTKLLKLNLEYGNSWTKISSFFKNKKKEDVKNDFFCMLRKSLRAACKSLGRKDGSKLLRKIKPKTCSEFLTREIKIDLREIEGNNCEPKFLYVNLFEFVKKFAFFKSNYVFRKFEKKEIFIVKKCMEYLVDLDNEVLKDFDRDKKNFNFIFLKNHGKIFEKFQNFILKKKLSILSDLKNMNGFFNKDENIKMKFVKELQNLNFFTDGLISKIKNTSDDKIKLQKDEIFRLFNNYQKNIKFNYLSKDKKSQNYQDIIKNFKLEFSPTKFDNKKNQNLKINKKNKNLKNKNIFSLKKNNFQNALNFIIKKKKKIKKHKSIKNNYNFLLIKQPKKKIKKKIFSNSKNEICFLFSNKIQKTSYKIVHLFSKQIQRKNRILVVRSINNYFVHERLRHYEEGEATKSKLSSFDENY